MSDLIAPPTKFKLTMKQRLASKMMDYNPGVWVIYQAGTGKTACALDFIYRNLWKYHMECDVENGIPDALVVCPAAICSSWEVSIDKMQFFEGYTAEGIELVKKFTTIVSFQKTYHTRKVTKKVKGVWKEVSEPYLREEMDKPWGCVVVDESHGIGNHAGAQTQACLYLADLTKHRIPMSGTPVAGGKGRNDYSKMYGQLQFATAGKLWKNWSEFVRLYVTATDDWYKPIAYRDELCEQLMKDYGVVARLDECYDLPDSIDEMVPCKMTKKARKIYDELDEGEYEKYDIQVDMPGSQFNKMLQLCSGNIKRDRWTVEEDENGNFVKVEKKIPPIVTDCSKEDVLLDIINGTDDKICIFCNYTASIERVKNLIEKHRSKMNRPARYVIKSGNYKGDWRDFQFGDADIFIGQYASGGVGLDLFASHTMILYEPCFSALLFTQTKARIMRKGQTKKCIYHFFYTPGTIEGRVWKTVMDGFDVSEKLMDEWSKEGLH